MRVVDLGTFLLPIRFSLTELMTGGDADISAALSHELAEFRGDGAAASSGLLLDAHRSVGARQLESMLFSGTTEVAGLGVVRLFVSSLAVCFVVAEAELPDEAVTDLATSGEWAAFKAHETPVTDAIGPLVAGWSQRIAAAVPVRLRQSRPSVAMAAGQLLWWHRIAVDPAPGKEFAAARWYGVRAELAGGVTASVGNGFTNLHGGTAAGVLADVVEGLMVATQEWLIVDEAKRLLSDHLVRLTRTRAEGLVGVDTQYVELLQVTEEVTLRNLLISEELRYLANARTRVRQAAIEAWRMAEETAELEGRISALRELFGLHRDRIAGDRDDRRNGYILVLTAVTLIQSVLLWYDFATSSATTFGGAPRPLLTIVVIALTVLAIAAGVGVVWRSRRRAQRRVSG